MYIYNFFSIRNFSIIYRFQNIFRYPLAHQRMLLAREDKIPFGCFGFSRLAVIPWVPSYDDLTCVSRGIAFMPIRERRTIRRNARYVHICDSSSEFVILRWRKLYGIKNEMSKPINLPLNFFLTFQYFIWKMILDAWSILL